MKPETMEWVDKADADLDTAKREATVVESPNYDAVCFHAQQCAEKYLKAVLVEVGYQDMTADEDDAEESVKAMVAIRDVVRVILGCS